jgi:hypothetical protein
VDRDLDAEKLRTLREWSESLQRDSRPELTAAGRAISLLVAEVERLRILLWGDRPYAEPASEADPGAATDEPLPEELVPSLRERLGRRWLPTARD